MSINSSMFRKHKQTSLKAASSSTEESVFHPLPNLFRLLGLTPFKKVNVCCLKNLYQECLFDVVVIKFGCVSGLHNMSIDFFSSFFFLFKYL